MERFEKADLSLLVRKPPFEFAGLSQLGRDVELVSTDPRINLHLLARADQVDEREATDHSKGGEALEKNAYENRAENESDTGDENEDTPLFDIADPTIEFKSFQAMMQSWRTQRDVLHPSNLAETSLDRDYNWTYEIPNHLGFVNEVRVSNEPPTHGSHRQLGHGIKAFQMFLTEENRLEAGLPAPQAFENLQITFPNRTGRNEMFVSYTISEDRSDDSGGQQTTRLAALTDRTRSSKTFDNDHDRDDLRGRFWSPDPLLHHLDEPYRHRLLMYVKEEREGYFHCLVPDCVNITATKEEWADHVEDEHEDWNDSLREDFGLPPLPIDENGLVSQDIDRLQTESGFSRRKVVKTLRQNDNDIEKAISSLNLGESAMEEVD